jgi:hypothetical protein
VNNVFKGLNLKYRDFVGIKNIFNKNKNTIIGKKLVNRTMQTINVIQKFRSIKIYLRSLISQERLNGLKILSIEKYMFENIDVVVIINNFASQNARRKH